MHVTLRSHRSLWWCCTMRILSWISLNTLLGLCCLGILTPYSLQLLGKVQEAHNTTTTQMVGELTKGELQFQREMGVDITGRPIYPLPPPAVDRTIVFVLRSKTMESDLQFWNEVQRKLSDKKTIRLAGYCDDLQCIDFLKHNAGSAKFPVIAAGEIIGSESIVDADYRGSCYVTAERWFTPKQLNWRARTETPDHIAQEALNL